MIVSMLLWYIAVTLAGWFAFPLVFTLLRFLPDRGLALIKPVGMLVWGYVFWILTSLHILQNNVGGVLFGLMVLAMLAAWAWRRRQKEDLLTWLRTHLTIVVVGEAVFLVAFVVMCIVRAASPDISGTEKPMELAFINGILRSDTFPPHDPWLSGYAISYYYFGYIMAALLARVTGLDGAIAFNLSVASWFALAAVAAYGVIFNLLALREVRRQVVQWGHIAGAALLGPLFLLVMGNLEGMLEVIHARGWFWQTAADGTLVSPFWKGLNLLELTNPPSQPFAWAPNRIGGIWWWRASRVLQDFDMANGSREIIDEFPFFSFLLGDLHPHVLSIPFVLLTVALALSLYLRERSVETERFHLLSWFKHADAWAAVVALGALAFLNTWDFPIYLALYGAAYALAHFERGERWQRWGFDTLVMVGLTGLAAVAAYLPFYLGFQSQAGGVLPSLVFFTRGTFFWIMFGGMLVPLLMWLIGMARKTRPNWRAGGIFTLIMVGGLWLLMSLYGWLIVENGPLAGIYGADATMPVVLESFLRRLVAPGTWLTLVVLLILIVGLMARRKATDEPGDGFVLLLLILGAGLTLFPEFFYLRDQFGWRMNTIFKFYYQGWVVWSLAAAYVTVILLSRLRGIARYGFAALWVVVLAMFLIYPTYALWNRISGSATESWTLDGSAFIARYQPDEMSAINWLKRAPVGVLAEAVGGSYTSYARASAFSGQPGVLGWPGHESQWRGGGKEIGSRESDLDQLFRATRMEQALPVIQRYGIRYIYIGSLEREKYRVNESFFSQNFSAVYQSGQATVYEVPAMMQPQQDGQP